MTIYGYRNNKTANWSTGRGTYMHIYDRYVVILVSINHDIRDQILVLQKAIYHVHVYMAYDDHDTAAS